MRVHLCEGPDLSQVHILSVSQGNDLVKGKYQVKGIVQYVLFVQPLTVLWDLEEGREEREGGREGRRERGREGEKERGEKERGGGGGNGEGRVREVEMGKCGEKKEMEQGPQNFPGIKPLLYLSFFAWGTISAGISRE